MLILLGVLLTGAAAYDSCGLVSEGCKCERRQIEELIKPLLSKVTFVVGFFTSACLAIF